MGEIRSPYFSLGQYYFGDNSDVHSPYFSYGRDHHGDSAEIHSPYSSSGDYLGDNAESHPPYSSAGDYDGDNAEIHPPYSSAGDYLGDKAEIHSETLFHQDISGNSYNAQQFVEPEIPRSVRVFVIDEQKSGVCIYRVRGALGKSNEAIYSPRQISIGPIHYRKKNLDFMEKKKTRYYEQLWGDRVSKERKRDELEDEFWGTLKGDEDKIRHCYEDGSHGIKNSRQFRDMILYDAVFIFELFFKYREGREKYTKDSILRESWLRWMIRRDLILLENQLPFFILEKLYKLLPENIRGEHPEFIALACSYFKSHIPSSFNPRAETSHSTAADTLHFTDLVRSLLSFNQKRKRVAPIKNYYSATKLRQAGVKFKTLQQCDCLLDVQFQRTRAEFCIPQLEIDNNTERLFRNLMAFEKRHHPGEEYICHYVKLLEILVAEHKDAKLLIENKIVTHIDEVGLKKLIHDLASDTDVHDSCYVDLCSSVEDYYQKSWNKNPAYFKEVFFGNVWKGIGTVSAALLLLLSFVQAICSILALR